MSNIIADPDRIDELAQQLREFARETQDGLGRVASLLTDLGRGDWQDDKQKDFETRFEQEIAAPIQRAIEALETQEVPYLSRLADQLREYLG